MMEHYVKGQRRSRTENSSSKCSLPMPWMLVTSRESMTSIRRFGFPDLDVGGLPLLSLSLCLASRALR